MSTLDITLPDAVKAYLDERVAEGGYNSVSEYVSELIRSDQRRRAEEHLDALLREGLESGEPIQPTPEYWESKKRELVQRHAKAE